MVIILGLLGCVEELSPLPTSINHVTTTITSSIGRCGIQIPCTGPGGCETNPENVITATLRAHDPLIRGRQIITAQMFLIQGNKIADWICPEQIRGNMWSTMGQIAKCARVRNGEQFTPGRFTFKIEGGIYEWNASLWATNKTIVQLYFGFLSNRSLPCPRF